MCDECACMCVWEGGWGAHLCVCTRTHKARSASVFSTVTKGYTVYLLGHPPRTSVTGASDRHTDNGKKLFASYAACCDLIYRCLDRLLSFNDLNVRLTWSHLVDT